MPGRPPPPPWGVLIAEALARNGLSAREAARRAGISDVRLGQIISGWECRGGRYVPVPARRPKAVRTLATIALVAGVTAAQLRQAGRDDAADVLASGALGDAAADALLRRISEMDPPQARQLLARLAAQLGAEPAVPAARRYGT